MKIRGSASSLVAIALAAICATPVVAAAAEDEPFLVSYRGELIDDSHAPISGVFHMRFKLYRSQTADSPVWSEHQFVAASHGRYDVRLGSVEPLPGRLAGEEFHLAVELGDAGEITRHTLRLTPWEREAAPTGPDVETITFADIADRALTAERADRARDCQTLDGKTLSEIDRYDALLERIATLRRDLSEDRGGGATVGSRTTTLERIGGAGGNTYTRSCPPGYVVTGARGGHGNLIDSMQLICSPLE